MKQVTKKRFTPRRIARIALKAILYLLLFIIIVILLIMTPPVQNFLKKKAVAYLENKLHTKVSVHRIFIGFPKKVIVENLYIEDRQKDTLLSAGRLQADIALFKLIFNGEVNINSVSLENSTVRIRRQLPDTAFNFQFIIDAFSSPAATPAPGSPSSSPIVIRKVSLDRIRLLFNDVVTGNDIETSLNHLDTRMDLIDPGHMRFDIPQINIAGLIAKVYQAKPLAEPEPASKDLKEPEAGEPMNMVLNLHNINLNRIDIDYRNDVSSIQAATSLGESRIRVRKIDLLNQSIELADISLSHTIAGLLLGKKPEAKVVVQEATKEVATRQQAGWRLSAGSIRLEENDIRFEDQNEPMQKNGMDYSHLAATGISLLVDDFLFSSDTISGHVRKAAFEEKSGFRLNALECAFLYTNTGASLRNLYLRTPGTELRREASIRYASVKDLQYNIGNIELQADLQNCKILVRDVLTFAPMLRMQPAFADPSATWYIDAGISGRVRDLQIERFLLKGMHDTKMSISGHIAGLPDMQQMSANLFIHSLASSRHDILAVIPRQSLPSNITLPAFIEARGKVQGTSSSMKADLSVHSDLGDVMVQGTLAQFSDPLRMKYDATLQTTALDIGTLIQQKDNPGAVTASLTVHGSGTTPESADATFRGKIISATLNQYTYHDIALDGSIANQKLKATAGISDPNIDVSLKADADLSTDFPSVMAEMMIDSIKMKPLHLSSDDVIYHGKAIAAFPRTDPDDLLGKLTVTESVLVRGENRLQMDTVSISSSKSDSGHAITISSDIANASLTGEYKLTEIGDVFQNIVQPYFAVSPVAVSPYDFRLTASIINHPTLHSLLPGLERLDSIELSGHFSSSTASTLRFKAAALDMGANQVRGLLVEASTDSAKLVVDASLARFSAGPGIELNNTTFNATLKDNNARFAINIRDREQKEKYSLSGILRQPTRDNYIVSLDPKSILLNYNTWGLSDSNKIIIAGGNVNATNFILSRDGQQLAITSESARADAPMRASFADFRLSTLTGFIQSDSSLIDGNMNGVLTVVEMSSNPVFTADLNIAGMQVSGDTVGDLHLLVNNKVSNTYNADITLSGRGNDLRLTGNYSPLNKANAFDFLLDIRKMPLTTAQALSGASIRDASGSLNGKFQVRGNLQRPLVTGDLNFATARFTPSMLNSSFLIDGEKIEINQEGIRFNDFAIKDSAGNELVIDGTAATTNFTNYRFDMRIRANNFRALNSTRKDNRLFYGQLYFNTRMTIKGNEQLPVIDGRLTVNEKTKMTMVLPQREPGVSDREGVVEFVDKDAPAADSLFLAALDSLNKTPFTGMDVSMQIEVNKEADFTLIVDEGNGDFLNVKGEALLTSNVDRSGKVLLTGTYTLESGAYELSFNFLRRRFQIEQGSKITWEGEPTDATVDITAKYIANVAPLDLVKNQLGEDVSSSQRNTYLQKLPFDVVLKMEGELLQPKISFDIILPENKSYVVANEIIATVRTKLEQLRLEEGEMNKQVFALLLLNRFVSENPFASSDYTSASSLARQSVSKLMTEQLNRLAGDLIKGVDLNFDVQSSQDYTTGERADRTDLNVGLSKRLLNDRLTVTIGSNFELEGPANSNQQSSNIAGNVALDYKLSRDGRYLLRAYRKNEYQGVIDGYVIETGVGFIITLDYYRFSEIFQNRARQREERRKRSLAGQKEQSKNEQTPAGSSKQP